MSEQVRHKSTGAVGTVEDTFTVDNPYAGDDMQGTWYTVQWDGGDRFSVPASAVTATHITYMPGVEVECDCSDEYGPCEDHGTAVVIREGASTRTADELAVIYCDDAAALLGELGGTVLDTDRDIVRDAWELLETERRHGVAWFPEDDAGEMLDECLRLGDALAADLSGLRHFTYWDDGYTIVRVHEDCPLLEG